ncbi:MAG TPA: 3-methyl-2-oxobutanoate hydroxymethyltransferase [Candidatus Acidoferrum sp.]|nr:3-methyl-2-oxobutanoate hydroxymethyltransferase [Candidatus Acidoferrum sp.]
MNSTRSKITPETIRSMKARGERIAALTAYDFPMAKLLDEAGIPFIHVGDSLGMVVLGYPDTTQVTMAETEHHLRAAARAKPNGLLGADLPYKSYETVADALANAKRLAAVGAEYVKLEGGREKLPQIKAILSAGIPVCGHLGMLPQSVREEGGYHVKGKKESEHQKLIEDACLLAEAGVFAIVLELVTPPVAREISEKIPVPTIGIGSGDGCDGQILVTPDLVGLFPWFRPRFVQPLADCAADIKSAVAQWKKSVETKH